MEHRIITQEYITKPEFNNAMLNIDERFSNVSQQFISLEDRIDKKFDNFRDEFFAYVREIMDEQRMHYEETHSREIGALREHIDHKFAVLQEHPVFTDYQTFAEERMNDY